MRVRDSSNLSPAPPEIDDQIFLGNTTDGNAIPFAGEETPFFLTFLSPVEAFGSQSVKRDNTAPNLTALIPIPDPANAPDGTAAPADLYPLPVSQPVRLYNRGLPNEHYGFYVYCDRSIFLESTAWTIVTLLTKMAVPMPRPAAHAGGLKRVSWYRSGPSHRIFLAWPYWDPLPSFPPPPLLQLHKYRSTICHAVNRIDAGCLLSPWAIGPSSLFAFDIDHYDARPVTFYREAPPEDTFKFPHINTSACAG